LREVGCLDYRVVSKRRLSLDNPDIERKAGMIDFYSMTVRAFKLELEDICEDYGQVATYLGTIPESPHSFTLDDHHLFKTGQPTLVCGNSAAMVQDTRYGKHFKVLGEKSTRRTGCTPLDPKRGRQALGRARRSASSSSPRCHCVSAHCSCLSTAAARLSTVLPLPGLWPIETDVGCSASLPPPTAGAVETDRDMSRPRSSAWFRLPAPPPLFSSQPA
jgi:hypothetical protein